MILLVIKVQKCHKIHNKINQKQLQMNMIKKYLKKIKINYNIGCCE